MLHQPGVVLESIAQFAEDIGEEFDIAADELQGAVELVANAGGQLADRLQLLRLSQLPLSLQPLLVFPLHLHMSLAQLLGALGDPLLQIFAQQGQFQMGLHPLEEFGGLERLGDIVNCPQLEPLDQVIGLYLGGEKNDRNLPSLGMFLEPPAGFEAVHFGHHDIEQDQVWYHLGDLLERLHAVLGDVELVPLLAQDGAQHLDILQGIVDDQDVWFSVFYHGPRPAV